MRPDNLALFRMEPPKQKEQGEVKTTPALPSGGILSPTSQAEPSIAAPQPLPGLPLSKVEHADRTEEKLHDETPQEVESKAIRDAMKASAAEAAVAAEEAVKQQPKDESRADTDISQIYDSLGKHNHGEHEDYYQVSP